MHRRKRATTVEKSVMIPWSWLNHIRCCAIDMATRAGQNVRHLRQESMASPLGPLRRRVGLVALSGLTLTVLPLSEAHAQSVEQSLNGWMSQPTLTGNWGGFRTQLANEGIDVYGNILGQM